MVITENLSIAECVDRIISKRKGRLPLLEEKQRMLMDIQEALSTFETQRAEMFLPDGSVAEGRYKAILTKYPEIAMQLSQISVEECRRRINTALQECDIAIRRFSRDHINIAVIGAARIGKSELLKAISNLSNYVIPAFNEEDCTGAVSVISNKPGASLKAVISFKTEKEMVAIVQEYLDKIISDKSKRIVIHTLCDIRDIKLSEVKARTTSGMADNNLMKYLRKYVEHYKEWANLVEKGSITLTEEKDIQTYVAQNNGETKDSPDRKDFYKYLAVASCNITCQYDYQEAGKINLVDTVGFEDNAIGIEDEMLNVVNNQSDAVIFMLYPLNGAGGGVPSKITDIYSKIENSCRGKNLNKWLFWLINHAPDHPYNADNLKFANTALATLKENDWHGDLIKIIDVHNQKEVREDFLIPLLNILIRSLDETDALFLQSFQDSLRDVKMEYNQICDIAGKALGNSGMLTENAQVRITESNEKLYYTISASLKRLCSGRLAVRDLDCQELQDEIDYLFEKIDDGELLPPREEIERMLVEEGKQNLEVYLHCCNTLRNKIVSSFSQLNVVIQDIVDDAKDQITDVLLHDGRLECILEPSQDGKKYAWLDEFSRQKLNEKEYPHLYEAFQNLYQFDFSVNGFLTYEVRACLDALDPDIGGVPGFTSAEPYKVAQHIYLALDQKLRNNFVTLLTDRLEDLVVKPNRAIFAAVTDFRDSVIYADNTKMEWFRLFLNHSREMWSDIYRQSAGNNAISQELQSVMDGLTKYGKSTDNFKLSI
ncbi:MAG: hypothetical protein LUG93_17495 [Lachnospiraceae bacterium]|nr:hypothetical protein [Lachnospiraceae bacterium]